MLWTGILFRSAPQNSSNKHFHQISFCCSKTKRTSRDCAENELKNFNIMLSKYLFLRFIVFSMWMCIVSNVYWLKQRDEAHSFVLFNIKNNMFGVFVDFCTRKTVFKTVRMDCVHFTIKSNWKQESIPVGCVSPALHRTQGLRIP